jgi:hypothetical protein
MRVPLPKKPEIGRNWEKQAAKSAKFYCYLRKS